MRKLSEIKGEDALDVLADVLEPVSVIEQDEQFVKAVREKEFSKIEMVRYLLKNHKSEILKTMAIIDGKDVENYSPSIIELPVMLLDLLNDPDLLSLFTSQDTVTSSGSVTENTEETEAE